MCPCSQWLLSCSRGAAIPPDTGPVCTHDVGCTKAAPCCQLWAQGKDGSEGAGVCPKGGTQLLLGSCFKMPGLAGSARFLAELKGAGGAALDGSFGLVVVAQRYGPESVSLAASLQWAAEGLGLTGRC